MSALPIYLDHAATTPVLPEVTAEITRALEEDFGNPSSRHAVGLRAEERIQAARSLIARQAGASQPSQVIFTSGGTEANALAMLALARKNRTGRIIVSAIEHPSVRNTAALLESTGIGVETVPATAGGWIEPERVAGMTRPDTFLVAVMHVNNETGIEQPVKEIARLVKRRAPRCRVLVDAVQSFTSLPTTLGGMGADLITASAHKVHGPKGVGCLVAAADLHLPPLWGGGDQEGGRRPGTENVPGIVGFARAVELANERGDPERLRDSSRRLLEGIVRCRPEAYAIGDQGRRVPQILAVAVPGVPTEALVNLLEARGLCASSGAACHSRRSLRSHVLEALEIPPDHGVIRLSLSHTTTDEDTTRAVQILEEALPQL
jgi:cysteine desulfurase